MDIFAAIVDKIIKEQERIIGPIAWEEARKVEGLIINKTRDSFELQGDKKKIIDMLVKQYSRLFGQVSEEVCKEAVKDLLNLLPETKIPHSLRITI